MKAVDIAIWCEIYRGGHVNISCSILNTCLREHNLEQANTGNFNQIGQGNPYSNTYNPG